MSGKPTVSEETHERIRQLSAKGYGLTDLMAEIGCSSYTVRKALVPGFAEAEAARHREKAAERYAVRKINPEYIERQRIENKSLRHLERSRRIRHVKWMEEKAANAVKRRRRIEERAIAVETRLVEGKSVAEVARELGISRTTVRRIKKVAERERIG